MFPFPQLSKVMNCRKSSSRCSGTAGLRTVYGQIRSRPLTARRIATQRSIQILKEANESKREISSYSFRFRSVRYIVRQLLLLRGSAVPVLGGVQERRRRLLRCSRISPLVARLRDLPDAFSELRVQFRFDQGVRRVPKSASSVSDQLIWKEETE